MKVLLINGSPKPDGNTYLSLNEIALMLNRFDVETEIFHIGNQMIRGCIACKKCNELKHCFFNDDICNKMIEKMVNSDGIIIGSPVYYAGPNGALCALLDRAFYSAGSLLKHKIGASVVVCRRGGASAAFDRLNKYFTINEMPVVSSQYWNSVHGRLKGEVLEDEEGMQTMRTLAVNMVNMLDLKNKGGFITLDEERISTNFIR